MRVPCMLCVSHVVCAVCHACCVLCLSYVLHVYFELVYVVCLVCCIFVCCVCVCLCILCVCLVCLVCAACQYMQYMLCVACVLVHCMCCVWKCVHTLSSRSGYPGAFRKLSQESFPHTCQVPTDHLPFYTWGCYLICLLLGKKGRNLRFLIIIKLVFAVANEAVSVCLSSNVHGSSNVNRSANVFLCWSGHCGV